MPIELSEGMVDLVATRLRAIGDPMRIRVLSTLSRGDLTVGELAERIGTSQQNVSHHLSILFSEAIVDRRRDGRTTIYSLSDPTVAAICDAVCASIEERINALQNIVEEDRA